MLILGTFHSSQVIIIVVKSNWYQRVKMTVLKGKYSFISQNIDNQLKSWWSIILNVEFNDKFWYHIGKTYIYNTSTLTKFDSLDCWRPPFVLHVPANLWARATFTLKVVLIISSQYALQPITRAIDVHCPLLWINCYRFIAIYSFKRCKFESKDFLHIRMYVWEESHIRLESAAVSSIVQVSSSSCFLLSATVRACCHLTTK